MAGLDALAGRAETVAWLVASGFSRTIPSRGLHSHQSNSLTPGGCLTATRFLRPPLWVHAAVLLTIVAAVYGPDVGRGFVKDDFRWVLESRVRAAADLPRLFVETSGFYRPLVSLSFAANEGLGGASPRCYGWTNL